MAQKTNPISLRLNYIRGWQSNWAPDKKTFVKNLCEDNAIRNCLLAYFPKEIISKTIIDRTLKNVTLTIHSSRPGVLIGSGGSKLTDFTKKLKKICSQDVQINVSEVRNPELDARLVGESISTQLKAHIHYKKVIKQVISNTINASAKGIKVRIGGRLAGAEIARSEEFKQGETPLHTLRADIDYARVKHRTSYGVIGIKVWICRKHVYGKRDLSLNLEVRAKQNEQRKRPLARRR